ncbi:unnamed protein product [Victoria cruziana]
MNSGGNARRDLSDHRVQEDDGRATGKGRKKATEKLIDGYVLVKSSPGPQQEDAELLPAGAVRVDEVVRLGIGGADDPAEPGSHVHDFAVLRRDDAGADGRRLDGLEDETVLLRHPAFDGVAEPPAVAERGPDRYGVEGRVGAGLGLGSVPAPVGLQCNPHDPGVHLLGEELRGDGEIEEEGRGGGEAVLLEAEADVAATVAVERAGDGGAGDGRPVVCRGVGGGARGGRGCGSGSRGGGGRGGRAALD